jgi:hypothetical protein
MASIGDSIRRRQMMAGALFMPFWLLGGSSRGMVSCGVESALALARAAIGFSEPKLVYLPPGTVIGAKPPEGWSHLVLKSIPRLASGDRGTLPAGSSRTATLFHSVMLADVKPVNVEEREFELDRLGVGICVPVPNDEGKDMVVTADRLDALGLRFSVVERAVLDAAEAELAEARIIARTPAFALFRSPVTAVSGDDHRKLTLNYAFCVDRPTGRLRVGVWTMRPEPKAQTPPTALVKLGTNTIFNCEIDVRAKRILGAIPYSWSFAMRSLPPGRTLRVPPQLGELITVASRRPADADLDELEFRMGEVLSSVPDSDKDRANAASRSVEPSVHRTAIPPPYRRPE